MIFSKIYCSKIKANNSRFDGKYFLNESSYLSMKVEDIPHSLPLSDIAEVFNPTIFKRQFCLKSEHSTYYFQSSDVPSASEKGNVYISREQSKKLNLLVNRGDILVTGFGSIGNTRLVNKCQHEVCYANNVCRIRVKKGSFSGFIYAFISSKYGIAQLNKNASGSVVRYIEAPGIKRTIIPNVTESLKIEIDQLIQDSILLREEAADELEAADKLLKEKAGLRPLTPEDYDYFGQHSATRKPSCFTRRSNEISSRSINAFNYSQRLERLKESLPDSRPLRNILLNNTTFSTGSFPRIEVKKGNGVMLINQSDAFDTIINGKWISTRNVNLSNLVSYGEVIIAGVGTLGENETFCRALFANEDLKGQLISGEFIRMKTTRDIPSGFLYAWLTSDYGFRLIRGTQAGTKLCRPIPEAFLDIPVPILAEEDMKEIDRMVRDAHSKRHLANVKELKAIAMVEAEIEKWN